MIVGRKRANRKRGEGHKSGVGLGLGQEIWGNIGWD